MIYELRTYSFKPGTVSGWIANFAEALTARSKYSTLGGLWHTDIGPLNEVVQIWPYENFNHRAEVRADVTREAGWPPKGSDAVLTQESQVLIPAPFSPTLGGGQKLGSIYEMRTYQFRPGSIPTVIDRFEPALNGGRLDLSPLAVMTHSETDGLNLLVHLWPYESFAHRDRVRTETKTLDTWPPDIGDFLIGQQNKILIPAACSPMA
jgi:hypothetical protein